MRLNINSVFTFIVAFTSVKSQVPFGYNPFAQQQQYYFNNQPQQTNRPNLYSGQSSPQNNYNGFSSNGQPQNNQNNYNSLGQQQSNFNYNNGGNNQNYYRETSSRPTIRQNNFQRPQYQSSQLNNQISQNSRVCARKCKEYTQQSKKTSNAGSLGLIPSIQKLRTDECDLSQGLVVGGGDARNGEFPHMAALGYRNSLGELSFDCGGTLISDRYILTAAHCKVGNRVPEVARLGCLNIKINEASQLDVRVESFISHPGYNAGTKKNDIALIKLTKTVPFGRYIRPACLHYSNIPFPENKAIATGWGSTENGGHGSDVLQKVKLSLFNAVNCKSQYYNDDDINLDKTQFCAGEEKGGKDTCHGDSGGPLQVASEEDKCSYYIIGITSYGRACGGPNEPGIYSKVSSYLDWIESNVWN